MKYYHATTVSNVQNIMSEGLHKGLDGVVYLTKKPEEAFRFVALRFHKQVVIIEVNIPLTAKDKLEESFDHSYEFFRCRAYAYSDNIPVSKCKIHSTYVLDSDTMKYRWEIV